MNKPTTKTIPIVDVEFFKRQQIYQHNAEMRSMLKNYVTISEALMNGGSPWNQIDETISNQFKQIDIKYPIYEVIDENGTPMGSV
jgi:hypothetical protein